MAKQKWILTAVVAVALLLMATAVVITMITRETSRPDNTDEGNTTNSSSSEKTELSYAEFLALSADEQTAFLNSFPSPADYAAWYSKAYSAWKDAQDSDNIILDGDSPVIDAEDLIG